MRRVVRLHYRKSILVLDAALRGGYGGQSSLKDALGGRNRADGSENRPYPDVGIGAGQRRLGDRFSGLARSLYKKEFFYQTNPSWREIWWRQIGWGLRKRHASRQPTLHGEGAVWRRIGWGQPTLHRKRAVFAKCGYRGRMAEYADRAAWLQRRGRRSQTAATGKQHQRLALT